MQEKDFYTYVCDICFNSDVRYEGLKIDCSLAATRELMKQGKTLIDIKEILEKGYDAPRKRKKDIIEKWYDKGKKTYNAVIGKSYDRLTQEEVWVVIHFGKFVRRKKHEMF